MALKNDFYNDIFKNEEKWENLINSGLVNPIYCDLELRPFYLEKKKEIEEEYRVTNNQILSQVLTIIEDIIKNIDLIINEYNKNGTSNVKSLLPIFLTNQMNNTNQKYEADPTIKVEVDENNEDDDYLYDE